MRKTRAKNGKLTNAHNQLDLASLLGTPEPHARQPPGVILLYKPSKRTKISLVPSPSCQHHSLNQNNKITTPAERWFERFLCHSLFANGSNL